MREQIELLEHHADFTPHRSDVLHVVGELNPVDDHPARVMTLEPVDTADHGRLAGTRRTAYDDALTRFDIETDVAQRLEIAEPLADIPQLDHQLAGRNFLDIS